MPSWYARPVFFVSDVARSRLFYLDVLGFELAWDRGGVIQVRRGDCELILAEQVERVGGGRLFLELMPDELAAFKAEIPARAIPVRDVVWEYPCFEISDPDGNELLVWQGDDVGAS